MDKIPDDVIEAMASELHDWRAEEDGPIAPFLLRALAAAEAAGYVLVSKEPTEAQWRAGLHHTGPAPAYRAMIAARPKLS